MRLGTSNVSKLMVGSGAATKAYLGAVEVWSAIDPAITAFAAASGATNLTALSNLAAYLRGQSLLTSSRCFPFKSAQNAGSGSTVYGWGDLTTNNATLVNSPAWGAGGVAFTAASSHHARITDFTSNATLTVFSRINATANTTALAVYFAQNDAGAGKRSLLFGQSGDQPGDPLRILRSSDGGAVNIESCSDGTTGIGSDTCFSVQTVAGGGRSLWANKTPLSLTVTNAQTNRFNTDADWTLAAALNSGTALAFTTMTATNLLFVQATITDAQREAITDLVNAL